MRRKIRHDSEIRFRCLVCFFPSDKKGKTLTKWKQFGAFTKREKGKSFFFSFLFFGRITSPKISVRKRIKEHFLHLFPFGIINRLLSIAKRKKKEKKERKKVVHT